jgi:hypothetical protein
VTGQWHTGGEKGNKVFTGGEQVMEVTLRSDFKKTKMNCIKILGSGEVIGDALLMLVSIYSFPSPGMHTYIRVCLPLLDMRCSFKGSFLICVSYLSFLRSGSHILLMSMRTRHMMSNVNSMKEGI